jgi:hypothetical protein
MNKGNNLPLENGIKRRHYDPPFFQTCKKTLPENAIIFPISADIRAALSHFDERRKMRPSDVRRLRRLRSRAAILAANGGKDPDSLGAREARVLSIDDLGGGGDAPDRAIVEGSGGGPVVAADDDRGILADFLAGWKADDARVLADLARSFGMTDKAKD